MRHIGTVLVTIVVVLGSIGLGSSPGADSSPQAGIVAGELSTTWTAFTFSNPDPLFP